MADLFLQVLYASLLAGAAALVVFALRWILRRFNAPAALCYALWIALLLRMVLPTGWFSASPLSLLRWAAPAIDRSVEALERSAPAEAGAVTFPAPTPRPSASTPGDGPGTVRPNRPAAPTASGVALVPEDQADPAPSLLQVITGLWLAGAAAVWGYLFWSYLRLWLRLRTAVRVWRQDLGETWWVSDRIPGPFAFGLLRPRIYLPPGLEEDSLRYVLLHERQHIRQRDDLVKLVFFLAMGVHWFNPVLWAAWVLFCRDVELFCDQQVLRRLPGWGSARGYSAALLALAVPRSVPVLPLGFGEHSVKDRVRRALRFHGGLPLAAATVLVPAVIVLGSSFLFAAPAYAPLPQRPPELTVSLERDLVSTAAQPQVTYWGGSSASSPYPDQPPEMDPLVSSYTKPTLTLAFPSGEAPARLEAADYLLSGEEAVAADRSAGRLTGAKGQYYIPLHAHPATAGTGMDTRLIVFSCAWENGKETYTCDYAVLVQVPAVDPDTPLSEPVIVVDGRRLDLRDSSPSVWADYGTRITVTHPQGRAGQAELSVQRDGGGPATARIGQALDGDPSRPAFSVSLRPLDGLRGDQTQRYTLTYAWEDGAEEHYSFTVHASLPYPEVDLEAGRIRCFGEEDYLDWQDLSALLSAPASWADQGAVGRRNEAVTLEGHFPQFVEFSTALDGWAVVSVGQGVAHADTYVYRTHDGGLTWTETGRPEDAFWYPCDFYASPADGSTALLSISRFNGAHVYRTRDGGAAWEELDLPLSGAGWECTQIVDGTHLLFTLGEGRRYTVYSPDGGETWKAIGPLDDPEAIPQEDLPWPSSLGAGEEFWPDIGNWYDAPIKLLGLSPDRTAALFAFDSYSTGLDGLLLCVGGRLTYFPDLGWSHSPRMTSANPVWGDYDGDGADELAVSLCVGTGTGISLWDLHVFEWDGERLTRAASLFADELQRWTPRDIPGLPACAVVGSNIHFTAEGGALSAEIGMEDREGIPTVSYIGTLSCRVDYANGSLSLSGITYSASDGSITP